MIKHRTYRISAVAFAGLLSADVFAEIPLPKIEAVNKTKIKCFCDAQRKGKFYSVSGNKLIQQSVSNETGAMIKLELAENEFRSETKSVGDGCKEQPNVSCWARRRYFSVAGSQAPVAGGASITPDRIPYCEKYGSSLGSGDCKKRP